MKHVFRNNPTKRIFIISVKKINNNTGQKIIPNTLLSIDITSGEFIEPLRPSWPTIFPKGIVGPVGLLFRRRKQNASRRREISPSWSWEQTGIFNFVESPFYSFFLSQELDPVISLFAYFHFKALQIVVRISARGANFVSLLLEVELFNNEGFSL